MKTTIDLPDEIVLELKLRAVMQGRTVKDLVADLLRESLGLDKQDKQDRPQADAHIQIDEHGFPSFRYASTAVASDMTIEELLKLEQGVVQMEDLQRAGISG